MALSTRNAARRGATNTGTHGSTVSGSYVMRTRSGIAINPPAEQNISAKKMLSRSSLLFWMTVTSQNLILYSNVPQA
jgi:hypothetical protein